MKRPLLIWDVDDVLNLLTREYLVHADRVNHNRAAFYDLTENPPHLIFGCTREEYLADLDDFRKNFFSSLGASTVVKKFFEEYGSHFEHAALSAVPLRYAGISSQWVFENFGKWIRSYSFVPSPRTGESLPEYALSKAGQMLNASLHGCLIDDNEKNIIEAAEAGFDTILWPAPWNSAKECDPCEVLDKILAKYGVRK
jgi:hypothetical protein